jgi:hypothetical protein
MQKHVAKKPAKPAAPLRAKPEPRKVKAPASQPDKFTYALAQWTTERRKSGWFVARTTPAITDNKPEWSGPYETIETACLAIARRHAVELADRHTRSTETYRINVGDPLYGLKPTTRLAKAR